ncbi:MAG: hypothetical protein ACI8XO_004975 [Verrucomicrobiales bacterium]|jgi:hypothetical protein
MLVFSGKISYVAPSIWLERLTGLGLTPLALELRGHFLNYDQESWVRQWVEGQSAIQPDYADAHQDL